MLYVRVKRNRDGFFVLLKFIHKHTTIYIIECVVPISSDIKGEQIVLVMNYFCNLYGYMHFSVIYFPFK